MDNLTNLKAIWHTASTSSLPSSAEMLRLIKQFRRQRLKKKWLTIITSFLLAVLMIFVMFSYHSKMVTTRIGEVFMIVSSLWLAFTNIRSLKRFYQFDDSGSNMEFLAFIEKTRQNQIYYYKNTQVVVMLLNSAGLLFYLYELASRHLSWFVWLYGGIIVYLLVIWLFVRPLFFRRNSKKLNATRERLEKILNQLKSNET